MEKFLPEFKDDTDRIILISLLIASFIAYFLPALIVVLFLKKYISESTYNIAKAFFNFELLLFLISLIFFIPVVGQILSFVIGWIVLPVIALLNVILIIIDLCAICRKTEVFVPTLFKFL